MSRLVPQPPRLAVRRAGPADRLPLARMLELYQHELSDIWDQDLDVHGDYGYALDRFFDNPACDAFLAFVDGRHAGFALVDQAVKVGVDGHWMDQFFVLKKYRRQGIGMALARTVFGALPGAWEVGQMPANLAAQAFWRQVIGGFTDGRFSEHRFDGGHWQGVVQCFCCAGPE